MGMMMGESPRSTEPAVSTDGLATPATPEPEAGGVQLEGMPAIVRRRRRRKALAWGSGALALLLIAVGVAGYAILKHFNTNIEQDNITGMLGSRPVDTHPKAENILVLGSDSRNGLSRAFGSGLVTDQSDTMMIVHIPADRKWAEVMSIPRDSWVNIPSCEMGNGQKSQPHQFKINEAFAIGNLDGNHTNLGVACTVKTLEQDTGIFISHFVVINFTGFENMVSALGGVPECNPTSIDDPKSGLVLSAGHHTLTPKQALAYVRARYTLGDGSDLQRIGRQQAFMSSLVNRARSEIMNPLAIYNFLNSLTHSLTIDSQLGGIGGLYNLDESLKSVPSDKIAFFTLPNSLDPSNTANVLWTQPEDNKIFASFRDDVPASSKLFGSQSANSVDAAGAQPTGVASSSSSQGTADVGAAPAATRRSSSPSASGSAPGASGSAPGASGSAPGASGSPSASVSPSASPRASAPALNLQDRTANQNICAG
jgi:LCP family protein required for cell wall assembly